MHTYPNINFAMSFPIYCSESIDLGSMENRISGKINLRLIPLIKSDVQKVQANLHKTIFKKGIKFIKISYI